MFDLISKLEKIKTKQKKFFFKKVEIIKITAPFWCSSLFDIRKILFESFQCSIKCALTHVSFYFIFMSDFLAWVNPHQYSMWEWYVDRKLIFFMQWGVTHIVNILILTWICTKMTLCKKQYIHLASIDSIPLQQ